MPCERGDPGAREPHHGVILPMAERFPLAFGDVSNPRKSQEDGRNPEKQKKPCRSRGHDAPEKEQTESKSYDALDSVHDETKSAKGVTTTVGMIVRHRVWAMHGLGSSGMWPHGKTSSKGETTSPHVGQFG